MPGWPRFTAALLLALAAVLAPQAKAQASRDLIIARLDALERELSAREAFISAAQNGSQAAIGAVARFGETIAATRKTHASLQRVSAASIATPSQHEKSIQQLDVLAQALTAASRDAFNAQEQARAALDELEEHAVHLQLKASELANEVASQETVSPRLLTLADALRRETQAHALQARSAISGLREIVNTALAGIAALGPLGERTLEEISRLRPNEGTSGSIRGNTPATRAFSLSMEAAGVRLARIHNSLANLPVRLSADYPAPLAAGQALNELRREFAVMHPAEVK